MLDLTIVHFISQSKLDILNKDTNVPRIKLLKYQYVVLDKSSNKIL